MPSRLIWTAPVGVYGLVTPATDGDLARICNRAVMRVRTAGSLTVPLDTCQTSESESPDCLGSDALSRLSALADSVPGRLKELE